MTLDSMYDCTFAVKMFSQKMASLFLNITIKLKSFFSNCNFAIRVLELIFSNLNDRNPSAQTELAPIKPGKFSYKINLKNCNVEPRHAA